jgi:hypothetical protein
MNNKTTVPLTVAASAMLLSTLGISGIAFAQTTNAAPGNTTLPSPPHVLPSTNSTTLAQSAGGSATNTTFLTTFHAKGFLGSFALPANSTHFKVNVQYLLVGNWSFDIVSGNLQNFTMNLQNVSLAGKAEHTYSVNGLTNVTGIGTRNVTSPNNTTSPATGANQNSSKSNKIVLTGNETAFGGLATIYSDGKPAWNNVLTSITVLNGKLINISFDSRKTEGRFAGNLIYGAITTLEDKGNNNIH